MSRNFMGSVPGITGFGEWSAPSGAPLCSQYRRRSGLGRLYDIELEGCDYRVRLNGKVLRGGSFPTPVSNDTKITRKTFVELEIEYLIGMAEE